MEVYEKMQPILNFCLLDAQVAIGSDFPFFAIAYTAIVLALENLEWFDFAEDLKSFMTSPTSELATQIFAVENFKEIDSKVWTLLFTKSK